MAAIDVSARAPGASASRLTKAAAAAAAGIRIITRPSSAPDSTAVQARRASEKSGTPRFSVDHPSADFPATHVRADVNHFVALDAADADRLATGNDDLQLHFEWEAGAYPAWAWAGTGDRIVGMGRWIFDCGHPGAMPGNCSVTTSQQCVLDSDCSSPTCSTCGDGETCVGVHFGYSAALHPPQATAAIRSGRGAIVSAVVATPVPATKADIYVSSYS